MNTPDNAHASPQPSLKQAFQRQLLQKLRDHYGRIPSCARFARDFALVANDVDPISVETARKWMRGSAMPHAARLQVLCEWLEIDFQKVGKGALSQHDEALAAAEGDLPSLEALLPLLRPAERQQLARAAAALLKNRRAALPGMSQ